MLRSLAQLFRAPAPVDPDFLRERRRREAQAIVAGAATAMHRRNIPEIKPGDNPAPMSPLFVLDALRERRAIQRTA